ncbi:hypothetical protein PHISCL_09697, partial [Aspergillus sclerotialis]
MTASSGCLLDYVNSPKGRSLPVPVSSAKSSHSSASRPRYASSPARMAHFYVVLLSIILIALPTVSATLLPPPTDHNSPSIPSREIVTDQSPPQEYNIQLQRQPQSQSQTEEQSEYFNPTLDLTKRASPSSDWTFPTPFDTSLSSNFTTKSCPKFFSSLLSNPSLLNCHALSLLLQDSTSFFHTLTSLPFTSRTLDTACAAPVSKCSSLLTDFANKLLDQSNCGKDYSLGNPLVRNLYRDLVAYEPVYRSSCLTSSESNSTGYCFVDAVFSNNSADYNLYFLPLGGELTRGVHLTCSTCLQATMGVYADWAAVEGQPLARSYIPSAKVVENACGKGFVDVNVTVAG